MKKLRAILISVLFAFAVAVPVVAALGPVPSAHSTIKRIAEGPAPTRTLPGDPPGPCTSGGC